MKKIKNSKATQSSLGKSIKAKSKKKKVKSTYYFGGLIVTSVNSLGVFASSAV